MESLEIYISSWRSHADSRKCSLPPPIFRMIDHVPKCIYYVRMYVHVPNIVMCRVSYSEQGFLSGETLLSCMCVHVCRGGEDGMVKRMYGYTTGTLS